MNTYLTRGEEGASGTVAQQHRGTTAPICARPHLQRLSRLLTRSQATETLAREAMVVESPRHGGELDWVEMNARRGRRTEAREAIPLGQKEAREAVVRLPHAAAAETAGAHQNRATTPLATRSRHSARGIMVRVSSRGVRRGLSPTGPAGST
jgi:hypothetical protein